MERTEIEDALIDMISNQLIGQHALDGETLNADDDLLGSGLLDSLGVMQLIRFLEERYAVTVPPADVTIDHFMTISTIVSYLQSLREKAVTG